MDLKQLLEAVEYRLLQGQPGRVQQITYDSRRAGPDTLFVCLEGAATDGHVYVRSAYDAGCRAFLCRHAVALPADACVAVTPDTRSALARISAAFYGDPARRLKLIGLTGTKGKTTTALLIRAILEASGIPCGYIGSNGVYFAGQHFPTANTTPESLVLQAYLAQMADAGITHVVLEVSSQALANHRVDGLEFDTAVFTNLSPDHIGRGEHSSLDDYRQAKRRLFSQHSCGAVVYNADDTASDFMCRGLNVPLLGYSLKDPAAPYFARALEPYRQENSLGIRFTVDAGGTSLRAAMRAPGEFSVYNALAAMAVSGRCGVSLTQAANVLAQTDVEGRFQVVPGKPGVTFLVDYAHNGLSLTSALQVLRQYGPRRLICLFGSVGGRTQSRRRELAEAASRYADLCILTSDNPDREDPMAILQEILQYYDKSTPYIVEPDREVAVRRACAIAAPGDIVLLAGKGHEDYQLINGQKLPFSESAIIRQWADDGAKDQKEETICI